MNSNFLVELQQVAKQQSVLNQTRLFPKQLDWATSLVGRYSWQFLVLASFLTALLIQLWRGA